VKKVLREIFDCELTWRSWSAKIAVIFDYGAWCMLELCQFLIRVLQGSGTLSLLIDLGKLEAGL
jgi:hypothetical protein